MNQNSPWILDMDNIPEGLLKECLYIYSKVGVYMGRDLHLVAGYGFRNYSVRNRKDRIETRKELSLEREMHTYCARWFRPRGVYTYADMLKSKDRPERWNICHQCLKRLPGRILDLNDMLLYGPYETIGGVILFDLKPSDKDFALDGLKRAVRLRQL